MKILHLIVVLFFLFVCACDRPTSQPEQSDSDTTLDLEYEVAEEVRSSVQTALKEKESKAKAEKERLQKLATEKVAAEKKAEAERLAKEKEEAERLAKEKEEAEKAEAKEVVAKEAERLAKEKEEAEKAAAEKAEAERLAVEKAIAEHMAKVEAERLAKEKAEAEEAEAKEAAAKEAERLAKEKEEAEKAAAEKAEAERLAVEKAIAEHMAKIEAERIAKEKAEAKKVAEERAAAEKEEEERLAKEKAEQERLAKEKAEAERLAVEKAIAEHMAKVAAKKEAEAGKVIESGKIVDENETEAERLAKEKQEAERLAKEKAEAERLAKEKAEAERLAKEKQEAERLAKEKQEAERLAKEKAEAERLAKEKAEAERLAKEKAEAERLAKEKQEAERLAKEKAEAERLAKEKAEAERIAKEIAEREKAERIAKEIAAREEAERIAKEKQEGVALSFDFFYGQNKVLNVRDVRILMNGQEVSDNARMEAGTYSLRVEAKGFKILEKEILIPTDVQEWTIKEEMQLLPCKLQLIINTDYPVGSIIQPDKVLIDSKPYEDGITPGIHTIEVIKAGYKTIIEEIPVRLGEDFMFLRIMEVLPRKIRWNIIDSEKNTQLAPEAIFVDNRNVVAEPVLSLRPGRYHVQVKLVHYQDYSEYIEVKPDDSVMEVTIKMDAGSDTSEKTVVSSDEQEQKLEEPIEKKVESQPQVPQQTSSTVQTRKLVLKPYQEDFQVIQPWKIFINGQEVMPEAEYEVGSLLKMKLLFQDYMTFQREIFIGFGNEPQEVPFALTPLKPYKFTTIREVLNLDGIDYPYEFIVDNKLVEEHLVQLEPGEERFVLTVKVPESAYQMKIRAGYTYTDKLLNRAVQTIGHLQKIDVYAMKDHINQIRRTQGDEAALNVFRSIVISKFSILQMLFEEEKVYLLDYIATWEVKTEEQILLRESIEENLSKLLK
ncbi:MAG TPA: hypothetical protein PLB63_03965 [Planctomycetota bacterium]|nr:hypothetical protein [Planctomycetota bacterium]HQB00200.1 hypothetical protein [Planctomycetota bacterium]